jgi:diguanylate cyclase (GGDEF)-like protein
MDLENILDKLDPEERSFVTELIERDPLTGVYNRRKFDRDLKLLVAMAKRTPKGSSLIFIDIDNFKKYNDTHGHQEGDRTLQDVTRSIERSLREYDRIHIYRYGGEEFVVVIPNTTSTEAYAIAERVRKNVKRFSKVTISLGISHYREISDSMEGLLQDADRALFQAKGKGRNRVQMFKNNPDQPTA